ncbi:MAG: molybdopterin-dependent oxidoreductase [Anaerolineae bacterium]|nr:molybdopterin-dependent oxidoreductase [Anaerolineae bacterium]
MDELRAMPSASEIVTMSCISNPIGGPLISTTKWTGVPMSHILDLVLRADPSILLAYAWDDRPLLQKHGFPLRIHIPDLYGMKQPKWITGFEFVSDWAEGYWVRRGWSAIARVQTTSVIDTVAVSQTYESDGQTFIPIGGIVYTGARGVSRVQVRVDDGEWQDASLKAPLSDRTWQLWRYDWPYAAGRHTFVVRAIDGTGAEQTERQTPVRPDGATGYHQSIQSV